ncbi:hypothetical protein ACJX0J_028236, partial [Zea mays]
KIAQLGAGTGDRWRANHNTLTNAILANSLKQDLTHQNIVYNKAKPFMVYRSYLRLVIRMLIIEENWISHEE